VRKVKITLKPGSPGKKFYLFPTAEALYVWLCALEKGEQVQVPDIEELVLEPQGFIEVELRGFEYSYEEGQKHRRLDMVRLGKAQHPKNSSGLLVTIHSGWVSGGLMPLRTYSDSDIDVSTLNPASAKLDLPTLFKDEPVEEEVDVNVEEEDK
jgi:hypothetical protein